MIYLKKLFLYSAFYILCVIPYIISSTNFSSNNEYINKGNIKRSIEEINNFKYDNKITNNLSTNNRKKREIIKSQYKWTSPIYYQVDVSLNYRFIKKAIRILETSTCFRFVYISLSKNHFSGKKFEKGLQVIGIGNECLSLGGIIHMILRTLGIIYQHCRIDRDVFIKVFPENIAAEYMKDFQILPKSKIKHTPLPYEYGSVMHFGMQTGSKNRGYTLMPKDHLYENTVGQLDYPTFNDIKALNLHYCSKICKYTLICKNHGYQDPNDCGKCICIDGFA
ncbi:Astacin-like metalloendopeptidase, partial [Strongyloides ratti]